MSRGSDGDMSGSTWTVGGPSRIGGPITRRGLLKGSLLIGGVLAFPSFAAACTGGENDSTAATDDPPLERQVAQMLIVGFRGVTLEPSNYLYRDIEQYGIGGTIVFDFDAKLETTGRNITSPEQLQALTASLNALSGTPLLIAVDQEGGKVARLTEADGFPPTVSEQYLGTLDDPVATRQYADSIALTLASSGINMNFAPVVDLDVNPDSPAIGALGRSFSADPEVVARHAGIVVDAHDAAGVATCLKHFPGRLVASFHHRHPARRVGFRRGGRHRRLAEGGAYSVRTTACADRTTAPERGQVGRLAALTSGTIRNHHHQWASGTGPGPPERRRGYP